MRVLLVNHRYVPDGVGGIERVTQTLASELASEDHVSILSRRPALGKPLRTNLERLPDGTQLYRIVGGGTSPDRFLAHSEELERLFTTALIETAPDVVHVLHLLGLPPRLVEIAHRYGAAVVASLHDFYFACPLVHLQKRSGDVCGGPDGGKECARTCFAQDADAELRWGMRASYFRRLLALPQRVICPSDYVASYFNEFADHAEKIRVIANGVAHEVIEPDPVTTLPGGGEPGRLTVAFLGAVVEHKGVDLILEALERACLPSVDLRLLGITPDEVYARSLRKHAAAIPGLKLRLYGSYEAVELARLLDDVDCVVIPSRVPETFSITTREAFARGVPVLASRIGALPEAIAEGANGFLFALDRPDELAGALRRLAFDRQLLETLRAGARATRVMTAREHADAVRAVYDEAIEARLAAPPEPAGDEAEREFLFDTLVALGFAGPRLAPMSAWQNAVIA